MKITGYNQHPRYEEESKMFKRYGILCKLHIFKCKLLWDYIEIEEEK